MPEATPRLRAEIGVRPVLHEGETVYVLHDTSGLSEAQLAVSPTVMFIAAQLDGAASVLDIQDRFARETGGRFVSGEEVLAVLDALDEALFLEGEKFTLRFRQISDEFLSLPSRPAASAGSAYPAEPKALARELDAMLSGAPPCEAEEPGPEATPAGMIAPHIDYARGAAGYGQAYRLLSGLPPPETVVVLGTAHQPPAGGRVSVCVKDFAVPGGAIANDRELADLLIDSLAGVDGFRNDQLVHRGEHSVELQAVWLRHLWGEKVKLVPVLIGSVGEFLHGARPPEEIAAVPELARLAEALAEARQRKNVLLLASADLSHVGRYFEDERDISGEFLEEVEHADRAYLSAVAGGDPLAGIRSLAAHSDRYKVCGSACIYVLNSALRGRSGKLLGYHQAATPEMLQAVTFAAMVFA